MSKEIDICLEAIKAIDSADELLKYFAGIFDEKTFETAELYGLLQALKGRGFPLAEVVVLKKIKAQDSANQDLDFYIGSLLLNISPTEAEEHLQLAFQHNPSENVKIAYARALTKTGKLSHAVSMYRALFKNKHIDGLNVEYGILCLKVGDLVSAKKYLQLAESKSPTNPTVMFHLGELHAKTQDYKLAIHYLEKAAAIDTGLPSRWLSLGRVQKKAGQHAAAATAFVNASHLRPEREEVCLEAVACAKLANDPDLALPVYQHLMQINPDEVQWKVFHSKYLITIGQEEEAIALQKQCGVIGVLARLKMLNEFDSVEIDDLLNELNLVEIKQLGTPELLDLVIIINSYAPNHDLHQVALGEFFASLLVVPDKKTILSYLEKLAINTGDKKLMIDVRKASKVTGVIECCDAKDNINLLDRMQDSFEKRVFRQSALKSQINDFFLYLLVKLPFKERAAILGKLFSTLPPNLARQMAQPMMRKHAGNQTILHLKSIADDAYNNIDFGKFTVNRALQHKASHFDCRVDDARHLIQIGHGEDAVKAMNSLYKEKKNAVTVDALKKAYFANGQYFDAGKLHKSATGKDLNIGEQLSHVTGDSRSLTSAYFYVAKSDDLSLNKSVFFNLPDCLNVSAIPDDRINTVQTPAKWVYISSVKCEDIESQISRLKANRRRNAKAAVLYNDMDKSEFVIMVAAEHLQRAPSNLSELIPYLKTYLFVHEIH